MESSTVARSNFCWAAVLMHGSGYRTMKSVPKVTNHGGNKLWHLNVQDMAGTGFGKYFLYV